MSKRKLKIKGVVLEDGNIHYIGTYNKDTEEEDGYVPDVDYSNISWGRMKIPAIVNRLLFNDLINYKKYQEIIPLDLVYIHLWGGEYGSNKNSHS